MFLNDGAQLLLTRRREDRCLGRWQIRQAHLIKKGRQGEAGLLLGCPGVGQRRVGSEEVADGRRLPLQSDHPVPDRGEGHTGAVDLLGQLIALLTHCL